MRRATPFSSGSMVSVSKEQREPGGGEKEQVVGTGRLAPVGRILVRIRGLVPALSALSFALVHQFAAGDAGQARLQGGKGAPGRGLVQVDRLDHAVGPGPLDRLQDALRSLGTPDHTDLVTVQPSATRGSGLGASRAGPARRGEHRTQPMGRGPRLLRGWPERDAGAAQPGGREPGERAPTPARRAERLADLHPARLSPARQSRRTLGRRNPSSRRAAPCLRRRSCPGPGRPPLRRGRSRLA